MHGARRSFPSASSCSASLAAEAAARELPTTAARGRRESEAKLLPQSAAAPPTSFALPESDKVLLGSMFFDEAKIAAAFQKRGYAPDVGMTSSDLRDKVS